MRNKLNKRQHNTNQREAAQKDDDLPETRSRENTACTTAPPANIQNGRQGAQKWERRCGKMSTPRFLGILSNFRKISFLIRALLL